MIEISSQMREFVNFAQDAVANNDKNTVARLGKKESSYSTFPISAAVDGDSVGKLMRSAASKRANNTVRTEFRKVVEQMFGGADKIPQNVLAAMNMKDYAKGKPLTADRILDVYAAIKDHIKGLKDEALGNGTLRAVDVADSAADRYLEQFQKKCNVRLGAAVASNLKRALLLSAANMLDDNAVKGGAKAVKDFIHPLRDSFKYTIKALGFDVASRQIDIARIQNLMKDEVHMRAAVFALLDKDGNVDVNNFDKRLAMFNDDWLKRYSSSTVRPNLDTPGPAAVKALQKEFVRIAKLQVGDAAREEIQALYKANPDKIPASLRKNKLDSAAYVGFVKFFVAKQYAEAAGNSLAWSGDANAKIDIAAALKGFNDYTNAIYATAKGDKDIIELIDRFIGKLAYNGANELRSVEDIKKKFIEPIRSNLQELRTAAGGNAAILRSGLDALARNDMTPFKKGVFTKLANGAKAMSLRELNSISGKPTPIEVAKAFMGLYANFKKSITPADFVDKWSRNEKDAYTIFFSDVVMSRLNNDEKIHMVRTFGTDTAGDASNIMQLLVTANDVDTSQKDVSNIQEAVNMMRTCATFIGKAFSIDPDTFTVFQVNEKITSESVPTNVKEQFAALAKEIQE